jgi:hypothetical protein
MAIAMDMNVEGATLDQYQQVNAQLGITNDNLPDGLVFHWIADEGNGLRITDVWESREQFDTFAQDLGPAFAGVGLSDPPQMTFHEVANIFSA